MANDDSELGYFSSSAVALIAGEETEWERERNIEREVERERENYAVKDVIGWCGEKGEALNQAKTKPFSSGFNRLERRKGFKRVFKSKSRL